jgi:hypothetical protein
VAASPATEPSLVAGARQPPDDASCEQLDKYLGVQRALVLRKRSAAERYAIDIKTLQVEMDAAQEIASSALAVIETVEKRLKARKEAALASSSAAAAPPGEAVAAAKPSASSLDLLQAAMAAMPASFHAGPEGAALAAALANAAANLAIIRQLNADSLEDEVMDDEFVAAFAADTEVVKTLGSLKDSPQWTTASVAALWKERAGAKRSRTRTEEVMRVAPPPVATDASSSGAAQGPSGEMSPDYAADIKDFEAEAAVLKQEAAFSLAQAEEAKALATTTPKAPPAVALILAPKSASKRTPGGH